MSNTITVRPGIDMMKVIGKSKLTKKFLREYLAKNPQKDFQILSGRWSGAYINGEQCIDSDFTLDVIDPNYYSEHVAFVNFQRGGETEWGYQAVVS